MRRWLIPLILLLLIGGGIATAVAYGDGWDGWDRHHDEEITRVVNADGSETIVVHDDRPFFFPFGFLFFPLGFFLIFAFLRGFFWRGRWGGGGPGGYRGTPPWIDDWHRRAHEGDPRAPGGQTGATG